MKGCLEETGTEFLCLLQESLENYFLPDGYEQGSMKPLESAGSHLATMRKASLSLNIFCQRQKGEMEVKDFSECLDQASLEPKLTSKLPIV